nr:putative MerR family DNA-binding transcriptional regulator [uncultured bacterium]
MPNGTARTYSISDLSAEFAITTRTVRFYEEKGLLSPERAGNSRIYTPHDRTKLKLILRGKRLGFTLEESREIIEMYDPKSGNTTQLQRLIDTIHEKRALLERQLNDIQGMMDDLNGAEEKCIEAMTQTN